MGSYYVTPPDDTTQPQPGIPTPPGGVPSSAQVQPITAPPPGVAAQPKGPFSSYLDPSQVREPTHVASKERPSGYMGGLGKSAYIIDQFLGGLAKGRADSYNKSIKDQAAQYGRFDKALDDIGKMPDVTDADKRKLAQPILDAKLAILRGEINPDAVDGKDGKKGGGKKGKDQEHPNPIVHFIGQMADKVAGPGAQPQRMSGEYVSQVLGQVYPQMHALVGQRQQTEDANKEYMAAAAEAIGAVGADKEVNVADLWKSERFQAAHAKLAGLTKDGKISPDMVKPLEDMMKRRNAKPAEVELQDGSKIPVTVESDGTVKSGTTVMPPGSYKQLLWPGRMATETKPKAPTKFETDLADSKRYLGTLLNKDEKALTSEESHVAERLAGGDKDLRDRFEVNVKKGLAPEKAYDAAIAAHVKTLDSKQTGLDLTNAMKALGYALKKDQKDKLKPAEVQQTAHAVFNDVFQNKDPVVQAWAKKLSDRMLDAKATEKDAKEAAEELRGAVQKNVDSDDNYAELTDEQRKQVSVAVRGMDWQKIVPFVKGTASGKPGGGLGLSGQIAALKAGTPPAAGGNPSPATPAAQMRSSTPPGQGTPAPKPAAAAPAARQQEVATWKSHSGTVIKKGQVMEKDGKYFVIDKLYANGQGVPRPATEAEIAKAKAGQ